MHDMTGAADYHTSSKEKGYLTPVPYVEAARQTLGRIDLDPASCLTAQRDIKAHQWYGPGSPHGEDGLSQDWRGTVLLNPPGGYAPRGAESRSMATHWYQRLMCFWSIGMVESAIFVGFNMEILRSGQIAGSLSPTRFPFCIPRSRIRFDLDRSGVRLPATSPTHGCVIVCVTGEIKEALRFIDAFGGFGEVTIPGCQLPERIQVQV